MICYNEFIFKLGLGIQLGRAVPPWRDILPGGAIQLGRGLTVHAPSLSDTLVLSLCDRNAN